jgi:hypothetical protein
MVDKGTNKFYVQESDDTSQFYSQYNRILQTHHVKKHLKEL